MQKATYIVAWAAKGGKCYGSAGCSGSYFSVSLVGAEGEEKGLVNEVTSDNIKVGSQGETTVTIGDPGTYLLKVEASDLTWTITFTPA